MKGGKTLFNDKNVDVNGYVINKDKPVNTTFHSASKNVNSRGYVINPNLPVDDTSTYNDYYDDTSTYDDEEYSTSGNGIISKIFGILLFPVIVAIVVQFFLGIIDVIATLLSDLYPLLIVAVIFFTFRIPHAWSKFKENPKNYPKSKFKVFYLCNIVCCFFMLYTRLDINLALLRKILLNSNRQMDI